MGFKILTFCANLIQSRLCVRVEFIAVITGDVSYLGRKLRSFCCGDDNNLILFFFFFTSLTVKRFLTCFADSSSDVVPVRVRVEG